MSYTTKNYSTDGGDTLVIGGTLKVEEGATVTGLSANPLTAATADALGGVKVGTTLSISSGVLNVKPSEAQADSTATTIAQLKEDFNALLAKLIAAGFMAAPEVTE